MTISPTAIDSGEVVARLESECRALGSQKAFAERHDFSPAFICDVLQGRRDVTKKLAGALGYRKLVVWVQEGAENPHD